jgi:hypothetical protein
MEENTNPNALSAKPGRIVSVFGLIRGNPVDIGVESVRQKVTQFNSVEIFWE